MSQANLKQNNEIDLTELFMTIWQGRWILVCCVALSLIFAGLYLYAKQPLYESKLSIKENSLPPFLSKGYAMKQFSEYYYSEETLQEWYMKDAGSETKDSDVNDTSGSGLNTETLKLISLKQSNELNAQLTINSNDPMFIENLFNYMSFIRDKVTLDLEALIVNEIEFIQQQTNELDQTTDYITNLLFKINQYDRLVKRNGTKAIQITKPSNPRKISPKTNFVIALALFLGGSIGGGIILILTVVRNIRSGSIKHQD